MIPSLLLIVHLLIGDEDDSQSIPIEALSVIEPGGQ
jgi:hypothetical protein